MTGGIQREKERFEVSYLATTRRISNQRHQLEKSIIVDTITALHDCELGTTNDELSNFVKKTLGE